MTSQLQTQLNSKQDSLDRKLGVGGVQTLTDNITATADTYTFLGAKPVEIAYLAGVTSNLQTQLNGRLTLRVIKRLRVMARVPPTQTITHSSVYYLRRSLTCQEHRPISSHN